MSDPWGTAMAWAFGVCDYLHHVALCDDIPEGLGYRPAATVRGEGFDDESYPDATIVNMTGVEYKSLAVNEDTETGPLPWGEWSQYPYVVTHKGQDYLRIYTVDGSVKTQYFVDGIDVSREEFLGYLTPSQREASRPNGGTLTIKAGNVRVVDTPAMAL